MTEQPTTQAPPQYRGALAYRLVAGQMTINGMVTLLAEHETSRVITHVHGNEQEEGGEHIPSHYAPVTAVDVYYFHGCAGMVIEVQVHEAGQEPGKAFYQVTETGIEEVDGPGALWLEVITSCESDGSRLSSPNCTEHETQRAG
jgi:hypothetical protein